MATLIRHKATAALLAVVMLLLAPSVIKWTVYQPRWDDAYFLHRAVNLHRAVWTLDWRQWAETFSILVKSPLMALLSAPWGGAGRDAESVIGLSRVSLAILLWILILACLHTLVRMGVSWWWLVFAAVSVACNPIALTWAGVYLADVPVSWTFLLLLLLIPYEAMPDDDHSDKASLCRGMLWALAMSVGLLAKITFWPALLLAAPMVLWLRWKRHSLRAMARAAAVCVIASAPALAILIRYHTQFLGFAIAHSVGSTIPPPAFGVALVRYWNAMGASAYCDAALLIVALAGDYRKRAAPVWYAIAILGAYGIQVMRNPEQDLRYFLPVAIALPFLFAVAASRTASVNVPAGYFAGALAIGIAASMPLASKVNLQPAREVRSLLEACRAQGITDVVLATDSSRWNIETFRIAREMMGGSRSGIRVRAVVYSRPTGVPIKEDFATMTGADAVILETPTSREPDAQNRRVQQYRDFAQSHGTRIDVAPGFAVFRMTSK